jgi:hypothetical protein
MHFATCDLGQSFFELIHGVRIMFRDDGTKEIIEVGESRGMTDDELYPWLLLAKNGIEDRERPSGVDGGT